MPMNSASDCRQPNARTLVFLLPVQTLENPKELIDIRHIETHTVVPNENHDLLFLTLRASDFNLGSLAFAGELQRIGNEIDQCESQ